MHPGRSALWSSAVAAIASRGRSLRSVTAAAAALLLLLLTCLLKSQFVAQLLVIIRTHRTHPLHRCRLAAVSDAAWSGPSACVCLCLFVATVSCANTAAVIEMSFGTCTRLGQIHHVLGGEPITLGSTGASLGRPLLAHCKL